MIETETLSQSLPEINTELGVSPDFLQETLELQRIMLEPRDGDFAYESFLPEVVGYVPQEERQRFDELSYYPAHESTVWMPEKGGVLGPTGLKTAFPGTLEVIERDLERLGLSSDPDRTLVAEFEHNKTRAMTTPKTPGLHIDSLVIDREDGSEPLFYLIASKAATEYYQGPAHVTKKTGSNGRKMLLAHEEGTQDEMGFGENGLIVPGPDYGIVRLHGLTIHRSPLVQEETHRTFCRVKLRSRSEAEAILT